MAVQRPSACTHGRWRLPGEAAAAHSALLLLLLQCSSCERPPASLHTGWRPSTARSSQHPSAPVAAQQQLLQGLQAGELRWQRAVEVVGVQVEHAQGCVQEAWRGIQRVCGVGREGGGAVHWGWLWRRQQQAHPSRAPVRLAREGEMVPVSAFHCGSSCGEGCFGRQSGRTRGHAADWACRRRPQPCQYPWLGCPPPTHTRMHMHTTPGAHLRDAWVPKVDLQHPTAVHNALGLITHLRAARHAGPGEAAGQSAVGGVGGGRPGLRCT